jgi:hypothetical protein
MIDGSAVGEHHQGCTGFSSGPVMERNAFAFEETFG